MIFRRRPQAGAGTGRHDVPPCPAEVAAGLHDACHGWLIMWSPWRRTFTAFSAITTEALVIDEPYVHALLDRIGQVEHAVMAGWPITP